MEIAESAIHQMLLNGVKGGAKIYEEDPGIVARGVQVLEESMKEASSVPVLAL